MFGFFDWLVNAISQAWNFITNIITNMIELVALLLNAQQSLLLVVGYLPTFISSFALAYIAVRIVFMLVGRESE